jgi:hypothetical protein
MQNPTIAKEWKSGFLDKKQKRIDTCSPEVTRSEVLSEGKLSVIE